ncbi:hypothetical protein K1I42_09660 [Hydrogenophilus thermoluteolus]|nr:hypothetical protein [Hydrogenophilus thermoluteolus]MBW7657551.1 hypothetical protein [Hydrogenophilus thermoluteolus]
MMVLSEWQNDVALLEHAIAAKLIALGGNWEDGAALHRLAREIFHCQDRETLHRCLYSTKLQEQVLAELVGLSQLMLHLMAHSAQEGVELHAGPIWKAFARALYQEGEAMGVLSASQRG